MYDSSRALMAEMRAAGIDYRSDTPEEDDNLIDTVRVSWRGRSLPRTTVLFRLNDRGAHLEALGVADLLGKPRAQVLEKLNELNATYRWLTFTLNENGQVDCHTDVFMVPEVAGLFGIAAMGRMFDTLDEVYPGLAALEAPH